MHWLLIYFGFLVNAYNCFSKLYVHRDKNYTCNYVCWPLVNLADCCQCRYQLGSSWDIMGFVGCYHLFTDCSCLRNQRMSEAQERWYVSDTLWWGQQVQHLKRRKALQSYCSILCCGKVIFKSFGPGAIFPWHISWTQVCLTQAVKAKTTQC